MNKCYRKNRLEENRTNRNDRETKKHINRIRNFILKWYRKENRDSSKKIS